MVLPWSNFGTRPASTQNPSYISVKKYKPKMKRPGSRKRNCGTRFYTYILDDEILERNQKIDTTYQMTSRKSDQ